MNERDHSGATSSQGPDPRIRVMLVDDHQIVREGLRALLSAQPDIEVVGEAGDGPEAVELAHRLHAEVVVMDLELPNMDGLKVSQRILAHHADTRIVILSASVDRSRIDDALRVGIAGYVLKLNASSELLHAIRRVTRGESFVCREVSSILLGGYREMLSSSARAEPVLSPREIEVLKLIAAGRNTKEAAGDLGLSVKTVESHRARIMARLGLRSVAELTKYAIRKGFTSA